MSNVILTVEQAKVIADLLEEGLAGIGIFDDFDEKIDSMIDDGCSREECIAFAEKCMFVQSFINQFRDEESKWVGEFVVETEEQLEFRDM